MIDGFMQLLASLGNIANLIYNIIENICSSLLQLLSYGYNALSFLTTLFSTTPHVIYGGLLSMGITTGIGAIVLRIIVDLL